MHAGGHFSSEYMKLLSSIHTAGTVPCELFPKFWFPEDFPEPDTREAATILAKKLCTLCPIQKQCFEYALKNDERHGIWGGTSPDER